MKDVDIHMGDKLRIRRWKDIINDPNAYKQDDSYVLSEYKKMYLVPRMKYLCGKPFTISDILRDSCGNYYYMSEEKYEEIEDGHWYLITSEMLERDTEWNQSDEYDWEVAEDEDIIELLQVG